MLPDVKNAVDLVCKISGVGKELLLSSSRDKDVIIARTIICDLCVQVIKLPKYTVGKEINRHHTSVANLLNSHAQRMKTDQYYKKIYLDCFVTFTNSNKERIQ